MIYWKNFEFELEGRDMRIFFLDRCFDQEDFGFIFKKNGFGIICMYIIKFIISLNGLVRKLNKTRHILFLFDLSVHLWQWIDIYRFLNLLQFFQKEQKKIFALTIIWRLINYRSVRNNSKSSLNLNFDFSSFKNSKFLR